MEAFKRETGAFDNITPDGTKVGGTFRFEIDEKAEPYRRIHLHDIRLYGANGNGHEQVHGIYKFIDDNTIMFCNRFDGKYPTEFENGEPQKCNVFTLKREPEVEKTEK